MAATVHETRTTDGMERDTGVTLSPPLNFLIPWSGYPGVGKKEVYNGPTHSLPTPVIWREAGSRELGERKRVHERLFESGIREVQEDKRNRGVTQNNAERRGRSREAPLQKERIEERTYCRGRSSRICPELNPEKRLGKQGEEDSLREWHG